MAAFVSKGVIITAVKIVLNIPGSSVLSVGRIVKAFWIRIRISVHGV
jgi:hypothetical protein